MSSNLIKMVVRKNIDKKENFQLIDSGKILIGIFIHLIILIFFIISFHVSFFDTGDLGGFVGVAIMGTLFEVSLIVTIIYWSLIFIFLCYKLRVFIRKRVSVTFIHYLLLILALLIIGCQIYMFIFPYSSILFTFGGFAPPIIALIILIYLLINNLQNKK